MSKVPIPDDWDGESYCCRIIQWPSSERWTAILLGLISWPMRGRFWDERTGTVTDAQAIGADIYDLNVTDGGCILGCIEDLLTGLTDIADAIKAKSCGCSTAATGEQSQPSIEIGDDAADAPPGYEQELYTGDDKCSLANWYWQQTIATIQAFLDYNVLGWLLQGVTLAIASILALTGVAELAVFLAIVFAELGAMTDLITVLLPLDEGDLQEVLDALEGDQEGFVCALYNTETIGEVISSLGAWCSSAGLTMPQATLIYAILNPYTMAGLFYVNDESLAEADAMTGKVNCFYCGDCDFVYAINGQVSLITLNGDPAFEITPNAGQTAVNMFINTYDGGGGSRLSCDPLEFYDSPPDTADTASSGVSLVGFYDHSNNLLASYDPRSEDVPDPQVCYGRIDVTFITAGAGYYRIKYDTTCEAP